MAIDPLNLAGTASLTFKAVFVSLSLWNGTTGTWSTGYWYDPVHANGDTLANNGEQEWYINANYAPTQAIRPWTVANDILSLTAAKAPRDIRPLIDDYKFTSGEINTFHSFSQTYGYFEMRAKLPEGKGLWPAFWLLPENGTWPPELDIMEVLGNQPRILYTTVHFGKDNKSDGKAIKVADMSKAFHTYGADWEKDTITWYFDRKPVYQVATPDDMRTPMFVEANLAAGGYWPGKINPRELPAAMQIDYIKAWSELPATGGGSQLPQDKSGTEGKTFVADNKAHQLLKGTPGNDIFYAGENSVVMEGMGGSNLFVFDYVPWNAGRITDFNPAKDHIDISGALAAAGYHGDAPFSDGVLAIMPTKAGGSELHLYPPSIAMDSTPQDFLIATLDHVAPSELHLAGNFIVK